MGKKFICHSKTVLYYRNVPVILLILAGDRGDTIDKTKNGRKQI